MVQYRDIFTLCRRGVLRWRFSLAGIALIGIAATSIALWPARHEARAPTPSLAEITAIMKVRCAGCHAEKPSIMPIAQMGVMLDTPERVRQHALRIHERSVRLKNMPLANMTRMTDEERAKIETWFAAGAK